MEALRFPAVAGRFYPGDPLSLTRSVRDLLHDGARDTAVEATAMLAPHAGYVYSGAVAGETYRAVRVPRRVVLLGPNHTGAGVPRSIWSRGAWRMPFGDVRIDEALCGALIEQAGLQPDTRAHEREHALEVHLPFLRERRPDVAIAPVVLSSLSYDECRDVGEGIARAVAAEAGGRRDVLIVASSDMSHYVTADVARSLDRLALDRIEALDPEGLHYVVRERRISMCGYVPMTVALVASLALGATRARVVRYGNSGETSGDFEHVVGYAGAVIW